MRHITNINAFIINKTDRLLLKNTQENKTPNFIIFKKESAQFHKVDKSLWELCTYKLKSQL